MFSCDGVELYPFLAQDVTDVPFGNSAFCQITTLKPHGLVLVLKKLKLGRPGGLSGFKMVTIKSQYLRLQTFVTCPP